ncbi:MAG: hypothetical protein M3O33_11055 [Cyanobacteriota bacterium]|nr:hypothetical protein [Cyanobacteriota bacterium]
MDETIRIRSIDHSAWSTTLQGFPPDRIEQILEVYGADGVVVGTICESVDGKYYINGKPEVEYASLQAAAGVIIQREN